MLHIYIYIYIYIYDISSLRVKQYNACLLIEIFAVKDKNTLPEKAISHTPRGRHRSGMFEEEMELTFKIRAGFIA